MSEKIVMILEEHERHFDLEFREQFNAVIRDSIPNSHMDYEVTTPGV